MSDTMTPEQREYAAAKAAYALAQARLSHAKRSLPPAQQTNVEWRKLYAAAERENHRRTYQQKASADGLLTIDLITREAMRLFRNSARFIAITGELNGETPP